MFFLILLIISISSSDLRCGLDWEDAISRCGTYCPSGTNIECGVGEICYSISVEDDEVLCTLFPTMAPTVSPTNSPPKLHTIYKQWWLWICVGIFVFVLILIYKCVSANRPEVGEESIEIVQNSIEII